MTVFAEPSDFKGLYFREMDAEGRALGFRDPGLEALDSCNASLSELHRMFTKLIQRGVHVPTAYYLDKDFDGKVIDGPHMTWEQLLWRISSDYFLLSQIVYTMLNPNMKTLDKVCCG